MRTFQIANNIDNIRTLGRVLTEPETKTLCFDWSLSGFEFRYTGRVLTGHFMAEGTTEPVEGFEDPTELRHKIWPRIAVYLDGSLRPHRIFTVDAKDKDEIIFSSGQKEDHIIRVVKLTEALKTGAAVDSFFGDGQILPVKEKRRPMIEFIGDSITVGYGNLSTIKTNSFYSEHQDPTKSYAGLTAEALGLEPQIIGYSGICAGFKEWNGKPYSMLDLYDYTNWIRDHGENAEKWDFKHHPAKIAVINLGTNDTDAALLLPNRAANEDQFEKDYYELLSKVRERNGLYTKIVCTMGDMTYYLWDRATRAAEKFIADTGDTKVWLFKLPGHAQTEMRGAKNHPGIPADQRMATALTAFLKTIMD